MNHDTLVATIIMIVLIALLGAASLAAGCEHGAWWVHYFNIGNCRQ